MKDGMTKLVQKHHVKQRKPILGWVAFSDLGEVDRNNSIALLRAKYGNSVLYKAVR